MFLLSRLFRTVFRVGRLRVTDAGGRQHVFGGDVPGPEIAIRLHDRPFEWAMAVNPRLAVGEGYMDGRLTFENCDIYEFLDFCALNTERFASWESFDPLLRFEMWFRRFQQLNPVERAQQNVAHHYDLSGRLYDLFLDADRQYSCAYFRSDNESLEAAQDNKKRHLEIGRAHV